MLGKALVVLEFAAILEPLELHNLRNASCKHRGRNCDGSAEIQ